MSQEQAVESAACIAAVLATDPDSRVFTTGRSIADIDGRQPEPLTLTRS